MYKTAYGNYPALPHVNDPQWMQVMIRSRIQSSTALRTDPCNQGSDNVLLMVYSGDVVSVMRDIRYDDWIAAKVGYKMGWLNVSDIGFKLIRQYDYAPLTSTQEMRTIGISASKHAPVPLKTELTPKNEDWFEVTTEHAIPQELLMSHVDQVKAQTQDFECVSSKDVGRIIKYLKGFAGAWGNRRTGAAAH